MSTLISMSSAPPSGPTAPEPVDPDLHCASDWLLRLQAAPDDPRLRHDLEAWLDQAPQHRQAWIRVNRAWGLVARAPADREQWPVTPRSWRRHGRWALPALAAALLLAFGPHLLLLWQADHMTGTGETRTVALADGSHIVLGARSALRTHVRGDARHVQLLRGQAYFSVVHDETHPFRVTVQDMQVIDLGTAFDIQATDRQYTVGVSEGEVAVHYRGHAHHLTPGEQLALERRTDRARLDQLPADRMAVWQEGRLFAQDRPIIDLIPTLERYGAGSILILDGALKQQRVTGSYDLSDVDAALAAILLPHGGRVLQLTPFLRVVLGPATSGS